MNSPAKSASTSIRHLSWRAVAKLAACVAGILSPIAAFPVTTTSCVPIAVFLCCLSLTCAILLPFLWKQSLGPQNPPELWERDSAVMRSWIRLSVWIRVAGMVALVVDLCFYRPYRGPGHLNLQMTLSPVAYMMLMWAAMLDEYIRRHKPKELAASHLAIKASQPVQSEHWGLNAHSTH
jgi:hypothetical protein